MAATAQPGVPSAGRPRAAAAAGSAGGSVGTRPPTQAGAGPWATNLGRRVAAGMVMVPPVLAGVYAGGVWFFAGTALVTFLALREFYALSARPRVKLIQPLGFLL